VPALVMAAARLVVGGPGTCVTAGRPLQRKQRGWVRSFPDMGKATEFWERARWCEDRAARATDPEVRKCWEQVAAAWYLTAEAVERAAPLIRQ